MSKPLFTKKHFEWIADMLTSLDDCVKDYSDLVKQFADSLQMTNPLFKKDAFIKACGIEEVKNDNVQ